MSNENDKKDTGKEYSGLKIILNDKSSFAEQLAELLKMYSSQNKNREPTCVEEPRADYSDMKILPQPEPLNLERELLRLAGQGMHKKILIHGFASPEDAQERIRNSDDDAYNTAVAMRRKPDLKHIFHKSSQYENYAIDKKHDMFIPNSEEKKFGGCDFKKVIQYIIIPEEDPAKKK